MLARLGASVHDSTLRGNSPTKAVESAAPQRWTSALEGPRLEVDRVASQKGGAVRFPKKARLARASVSTIAVALLGVFILATPASASSVTSFTPACGVIGTAVSITGTGFTSATGVTFNTTAAVTFVATTDTTATALVPAGATTGPITVETAAVDTPSATNFVVAAAAPATITSFAPTSGAVGASVVISGTNFCGATGVQFNATSATSFTVSSTGTSITATVPAGATSGPLHVTTPSGTANSAASFTVVGGPTITSFSPTSGPVGTSVVITGTNLLGATAVRFNGVTASFSPSTATSVTATVPSGATTGKITVVTPGGTATSLTDFTVTTAPIDRSVSFSFGQNSRVSGQVSSTNTACESLLPVVIQKQKGGSWKWVDTTATNKSGSYKSYIPPSNGKFRAKVNQQTLVNGVVCAGDTSPIRQP
jgi:hypothetical protein